MTGEQFTIVGLLITVIAAGATGQWVFGWVYRAMERDRDYWRKRALFWAGLSELATDEATKRADDDD